MLVLLGYFHVVFATRLSKYSTYSRQGKDCVTRTLGLMTELAVRGCEWRKGKYLRWIKRVSRFALFSSRIRGVLYFKQRISGKWCLVCTMYSRVVK